MHDELAAFATICTESSLHDESAAFATTWALPTHLPFSYSFSGFMLYYDVAQRAAAIVLKVNAYSNAQITE